MLLTTRARVYVNHGRVIADCPYPHCANAEKIDPGQTLFGCSNCRQVAHIEWPPNLAEILAVLGLRPVPQTRNWFPPGHELALRAGCPDGQTVPDLVAENWEYGIGDDPGLDSIGTEVL